MEAFQCDPSAIETKFCMMVLCLGGCKTQQVHVLYLVYSTCGLSTGYIESSHLMFDTVPRTNSLS